MKTIHIWYINKIKYMLGGIFEQEDSDYPDNRIIRNKERAIENCFKKAGITSEEDQREIYENVDWCWDGCAERLEALGWTVLRGKENFK